MKLEARVRSAAYLGTLILVLVVFAVLLFVFTRRVDGVSMRPTLEAGDMVILQFGSIGEVQKGDIIVFNDPTFGGCQDFTIIHRVVQVAADGGRTTQGANTATNRVPDEPDGGPHVQPHAPVG